MAVAGGGTWVLVVGVTDGLEGLGDGCGVWLLLDRLLLVLDAPELEGLHEGVDGGCGVPELPWHWVCWLGTWTGYTVGRAAAVGAAWPAGPPRLVRDRGLRPGGFCGCCRAGMAPCVSPLLPKLG